MTRAHSVEKRVIIPVTKPKPNLYTNLKEGPEELGTNIDECHLSNLGSIAVLTKVTIHFLSFAKL
jgi:hypothetical protein